MQHQKIAFIGAGNMAFAIINGLIRSGYPTDCIAACNKSNQARRVELAEMGIDVSLNNRQSVEWADCVILAVKPQMMAEVCQEFSNVDFSPKMVLSVAAGISIDRLSEMLPTAKNIVRAMPNTPALIGQGLSGLFAKRTVAQTACQFAEQLLSAVGECYWVDEECQINGIIALTGSSPAYFFRFMEAMQKSAMQMGFSEQDSRLLIQSVALGAAKLVAANPKQPFSQLRENVTSKGGTTAQALAVFEQYDMDRIVDEAMKATVNRAKEMEQSL